MSEYKGFQPNIEASFTGDTIVIRLDQTRFRIFELFPDWTVKQLKMFDIKDASIDSITLSCFDSDACSSLLVKYQGIYYKHTVFSFFYKYDENYHRLTLDKDFMYTDLKNIIPCGIYDILIYEKYREKYVNIFSNINPLNKLDKIVVDDDIF
jgi:hypothetical protein